MLITLYFVSNQYLQKQIIASRKKIPFLLIKIPQIDKKQLLVL